MPWQPTPVFFPGEFHGQRSLEGYSSQVTKNWTRLKRLSMPTRRIIQILCLFIQETLDSNQFPGDAVGLGIPLADSPL